MKLKQGRNMALMDVAIKRAARPKWRQDKDLGKFFEKEEDEMFIRKNRKKIPDEPSDAEIMGKIIEKYGE